jgi:hypothetical protein
VPGVDLTEWDGRVHLAPGTMNFTSSDEYSPAPVKILQEQS